MFCRQVSVKTNIERTSSLRSRAEGRSKAAHLSKKKLECGVIGIYYVPSTKLDLFL